MLDLSHITHTQWLSDCSQLDAEKDALKFSVPPTRNMYHTQNFDLKLGPSFCLLLCFVWGFLFVLPLLLMLSLLLFYSLLCSKLSRQPSKVFFKNGPKRRKIICEKRKFFGDHIQERVRDGYLRLNSISLCSNAGWMFWKGIVMHTWLPGYVSLLSLFGPKGIAEWRNWPN